MAPSKRGLIHIGPGIPPGPETSRPRAGWERIGFPLSSGIGPPRPVAGNSQTYARNTEERNEPPSSSRGGPLPQPPSRSSVARQTLKQSKASLRSKVKGAGCLRGRTQEPALVRPILGSPAAAAKSHRAPATSRSDLVGVGLLEESPPPWGNVLAGRLFAKAPSPAREFMTHLQSGQDMVWKGVATGLPGIRPSGRGDRLRLAWSLRIYPLSGQRWVRRVPGFLKS